MMWSHLVSDVSYAELHAFARRLNLPERAFDRDHYDVPETLHRRAVELGARPLSSRELVSRLTKAGLRRRRPRARGVGTTGQVGEVGQFVRDVPAG